MCALLTEVKKRSGATMLHVTHDRNEALRLADRMFVMEHGSIRETELVP
jgi:ABC-type sulfate/molybdate transport systems ATPase subunit